MPNVLTGLENLINNPPAWLADRRLGLLCNPASVDSEFRHARDLIHSRLPGHLTAIFSPQHGFFAEKQDNMIESADLMDPVLNIPVFSLYGKTRKPTAAMFDAIDVLIIDLLDVGTRVYTFLTTVSYCLEAAARTGKPVLVLDRPNPVGGLQVEGNRLLPDYASFVGRYPIPMRHGLTIGEYARFINDFYGIGCQLDVIPMTGWRRRMYYRDTGLHWVCPSPNLPTPESATVYPGQVIWEGTNISEGRGTALPFEIFGAPFLDTGKILADLEGNRLPGAILRPLVFEPTSGKWSGTPCRGFQIHVTDPIAFFPYETTLKLLSAILRLHGDRFEWKTSPYEYEFEKLAIDLILGDPQIRTALEKGTDPVELRRQWEPDLSEFAASTRPFQLYE